MRALKFLYNFVLGQSSVVCSVAAREEAVADSPAKSFLTFSWRVCGKPLASGVHPESEKSIHLLNTEIGASLVPPNRTPVKQISL